MGWRRTLLHLFLDPEDGSGCAGDFVGGKEKGCWALMPVEAMLLKGDDGGSFAGRGRR